MQIGYMSAIVPELSLQAAFALAAEIGYGSVEVMCWLPISDGRFFPGSTVFEAAVTANATPSGYL
jgi:sugar phosphate isomerase/epimerase